MSALAGLYTITPQKNGGFINLLKITKQAIAGGARVVQYRDKSSDSRRRIEEAGALCSLCRENEIIFIINDDTALAKAVGAHGVHLGRWDSAISEARSILGNQAIIGASCYNDLELAISARDAGADYVAFGSFFPSNTKPDAVRATPDLLYKAKATMDLPIVAIGGITADNAPPLITAGADMLAIIQGIFSQPDIKEAAGRFTALFDKPEETHEHIT